MEILRKRNASDGDSGFDSALSSRSSSISLEESPDFSDFKTSTVENSHTRDTLRDQFLHILEQDEDIVQDVCTPDLYIIRHRVSGRQTMYKPPGKLSFSANPAQIGETYSAEEYNRCNPIPRSQLFNARLQLELEKQVAAMELLEIDLVMDNALVPPPSLGIRVIGVNMIHGVPDKLNIYVKRVMEGSVAGIDDRIKVNDHIVEVNGISLVGVSQKLAADALSSCAVNPETGIVHFVLARQPPQQAYTTEPLAADGAEKAAEAETPTTAVPPVAEPEEALAASKAEQLTDASSKTEEETGGGAAELSPPPTVDGGSSPPPSDILVPEILHCGAVEAFIPVSPVAVPASLSTMPTHILVKISKFLSPQDRISLNQVNKSFQSIIMPCSNLQAIQPSSSSSKNRPATAAPVRLRNNARRGERSLPGGGVTPVVCAHRRSEEERVLVPCT